MNPLQRQAQHLAHMAQVGYTIDQVVEGTKRYLESRPTAEQFAQRLMRSVARSS